MSTAPHPATPPGTTHPHPHMVDPREWCPLCGWYAARSGHGCPPCEDKAKRDPNVREALALALQVPANAD